MKQSGEATRVWVADEVLEYLVQHPDAQDTLEGVCDWWLLERRVRRTVAEVEAALGQLVAKGLVMVQRGKDGKTHYRLNQQEDPRIREHLRRRQSRAPSATRGSPDKRGA